MQHEGAHQVRCAATKPFWRDESAKESARHLRGELIAGPRNERVIEVESNAQGPTLAVTPGKLREPQDAQRYPDRNALFLSQCPRSLWEL
jgi:hypothetical protein